jgi:hypothetical protein
MSPVRRAPGAGPAVTVAARSIRTAAALAHCVRATSSRSWSTPGLHAASSSQLDA